MRSLEEIQREIAEITTQARSGGPLPSEEKNYSLVIESIEAQPTMEHKIACMRCWVHGRMGMPALPEDIALLRFDQHQA